MYSSSVVTTLDIFSEELLLAYLNSCRVYLETIFTQKFLVNFKKRNFVETFE